MKLPFASAAILLLSTASSITSSDAFTTPTSTTMALTSMIRREDEMSWLRQNFEKEAERQLQQSQQHNVRRQQSHNQHQPHYYPPAPPKVHQPQYGQQSQHSNYHNRQQYGQQQQQRHHNNHNNNQQQQQQQQQRVLPMDYEDRINARFSRNHRRDRLRTALTWGAEMDRQRKEQQRQYQLQQVQQQLQELKEAKQRLAEQQQQQQQQYHEQYQQHQQNQQHHEYQQQQHPHGAAPPAMLVNTPIPIINFRTNSDFPGSKLPASQWGHVAKPPVIFDDAEYSSCERVTKHVLVPFYEGVTSGGVLSEDGELRIVVVEGVDHVVVQVIDDVLVQTTNTNAERAYWLQDKLRDAIYGQVRYGTVLQKLSSPIEVKVPPTAKDEDDDNDDNSSKEGEQQQHKTTTTVEMVEWIATSESLAIKEMSWEHIRTQGPELAEDPIKEVSAMQYLHRWVDNEEIVLQNSEEQQKQQENQQSHILMPLDLLSDDDHLYSITPFCTGGRLLDILESKNRFSEPEARYWMRQILKGLSCLKKAGVAHRDMSPENLMVHDGNVYIIDLGMCLRIPNMGDDSATTTKLQNNGQERTLIQPQSPCGKWYYLSPEVLLSEQPFDGPAVDLWAAGVILFIMLTGMPPWEEPKMTDENFKLMTTGYLMQILAERRVGLSADATDLLQRMLWLDPADRLSLDQVCAHPWMTHRDNLPFSENGESAA